MSFVTFLMALTFCLGNFVEANQNKSFRKDYTFLPESASFYKIHTLHKTWHDAKKRCTMEGTKLFYPESQPEVDAVITFWNKTQTFHWVYVGISDLLSKGAFETFDGIPIEDIYNTWGVGEPNDKDGAEDCVMLRRNGELNDVGCFFKYPFICKKTQASIEWNTFCHIPDSNYMYSSELGKCYKFHFQPMNWTEAHSYCNAEQSYLAIINSQKEADFLVKMTEESLKSKVKGNFVRGAVLLGFHNRDEEGWKTIKDTSIEDSGYSTWDNNQPDGKESTELCGSMSDNGKLSDISCKSKAFFICEHDIGLLSTSRQLNRKMTLFKKNKFHRTSI